MKSDAVYLQHILECIRRIEEDTRRGKESFVASHMVQDAVLRNLQTLTEASQRLTEELRLTHPDVEWERMAAFRNILVHDYLGVDLEQVWGIVRKDIPSLKEAISAMLKELS